MLTIVTTCKGRLEYLKQSLPSMLKTGLPVIVVDYDCPDGARRYVEENFANVRVVAINGRDTFNLSEARNLGAAAVASEFICFFDCDVLMHETFIDELRNISFSEDTFYVAGNCDLHGQCIVSKTAFHKIGGYDEVITGWGGEDGDLYLRLQAIGCRRAALAAGVVSTLTHPDHDRTKFTGGYSLKELHRLNVAYATIKRDIEALLSGYPLLVDERKQIRELVTQALRRTTETGRPYIIECQMHQKFGAVDYLLNGKTGYLLRRALRYEIAQVSPRMHTRFLTAVRRGRILSDLQRRMRQVLPRRVVRQDASSRWEDCVDMTGKSAKSASWGWLGRLAWPRNVRHNALESQEYHVKIHRDYRTGPTNGHRRNVDQFIKYRGVNLRPTLDSAHSQILDSSND